MKKIIIVILSILLLTSCSNYTDINDLAIISGMAIDYEDDLFKLTTQLIINDKESKIMIFNTKAKSISEAMREISKLSNKELFISHLKVLVLSDKLIESNVNYYDYFLRNSKSKMNFYTFIANSEDIEEVFKQYTDLDGSSMYLDKMMEFNQSIFSSTTPLRFIDMIYTKYEIGINNVYPTIEIKTNNKEKSLYLSNLVSYNSNSKKTTLSQTNSIFYNMITNNAKKTVLNIPCDNNYFTIEIQNTKTKYNWKNKIFTININSTGKLQEYNCKYNLNNSNTVNTLNKLSNKYIKENINDLITIMKNNNNDMIGIGNYIYKRDKNFFDFENKNWDNNLKNINIKINIKSNTKINSSGEIRNETK